MESGQSIFEPNVLRGYACFGFMSSLSSKETKYLLAICDMHLLNNLLTRFFRDDPTTGTTQCYIAWQADSQYTKQRW